MDAPRYSVWATSRRRSLPYLIQADRAFCLLGQETPSIFKVWKDLSNSSCLKFGQRYQTVSWQSRGLQVIRASGPRAYWLSEKLSRFLRPTQKLQSSSIRSISEQGLR